MTNKIISDEMVVQTKTVLRLSCEIHKFVSAFKMELKHSKLTKTKEKRWIESVVILWIMLFQEHIYYLRKFLVQVRDTSL